MLTNLRLHIRSLAASDIIYGILCTQSQKYANWHNDQDSGLVCRYSVLRSRVC